MFHHVINYQQEQCSDWMSNQHSSLWLVTVFGYHGYCKPETATPIILPTGEF